MVEPLAVHCPRKRVNSNRRLPREEIVDGEVADLDLRQGPQAGAGGGGGRAVVAGRPRNGARAVFGRDAELVFPREELVLRDARAPMGDVQAATPASHLDRLPDQGEGHGVAVAFEADQVVGGHDPGLASLEAEAWLTRGGDEVRPLPPEAIAGPLVGGAMHADIGHVVLPLAELLAQVNLIDELAAREKVALEVLHAGLDLALLQGVKYSRCSLIHR